MTHKAFRAEIVVVVVNYNSGLHLSKCLESLLRQSFSNFEVLVIDCNSTDRSFEAAKSGFGDERFSFSALDENVGFAQACNTAAKQIDTDLVVFLNPDASATTGWLDELVSASHRYPNVDAFGSTQIRCEDREVLDGAGDAYSAFGVPWRRGYGSRVPPFANDYSTFSVCGAAAMYRRRVFLELGGFDERYFCYLEDVDFGFRLRLKGRKVLQIATAVVSHVGGVSSDGDPDFALYHGIRNSIWTYVKNMPGLLLVLTLPGHITLITAVIAISVIRGQGRCAFSAASDAVRGLADILADRETLQTTRKTDVCEIAKTLTWSPIKLLRKSL